MAENTNNQLILSVTQLNFYVKSLLEGDVRLSDVFVKGEISKITFNSSGHIYFTLKDDGAAVDAALFRTYAGRLRFRPEEGMAVICRGNASLYDKTGRFQLYVKEMEPVGAGGLYIAFEQLKAKLKDEGLFDLSHKKPLPEFPEKIAVITSPTGAAVRDILSILKRRFPASEVLLCPVKVQGEGAAEDMCKALNTVCKNNAADLIIIGRGGGSAEDLWEFNSEKLARTIYNCTIPVISAVGHETDYTICDLVADVRAATPSAAAERAVPVADEVIAYFENANSRLKNALHSMLKVKNQYLQALSSHFTPKRGENIIAGYMITVDAQRDRLLAAYRRTLSRYNTTYEKNAAALYAFNPLALLSRGYTAVYKDGKNINSVSEIKSDDLLTLLFSDGKVTARVTETERNEKE